MTKAGDEYALVVAPAAQRAIAETLPEAVAAAVIDIITTALLEVPQRVGKPLHRSLAGIWAARRGTYRVLYRIDDLHHEVFVVRVEHRRDAYRPM